MKRPWLFGTGLALMALACGPRRWSLEGFKHPEHGGLTRAAYELDCPEGQLIVTDLGGEAMGVSGCGRRAVYKYVFNGGGWVNNSASDESPASKAKK